MGELKKTRKHVAEMWSRIGGGSYLRCRCGEWVSDITQTMKEQRAAHRAHRIENGEYVKPLAPTKVERLEREVERLQALATSSFTAAQEKDAEIAALQQRIYDLSDELTRAQSNADYQEQRAERVETELRAVDEECLRLHREHERLKHKLQKIHEVASRPLMSDREARGRVVGILNEP